MAQPFFSLITPVYNIEKLLSATIESALSQTFIDWEMILVDDGSPDNAGAICDEYASKYEKIKVIHKRNEGLAAARNDGIKASSGKYFMILEGSDLLTENNTLEKIFSVLHKNEVDIFFGKLRDVMENNGEVLSEQKDYCVSGFFDGGGKKLFETLFDNDDILALSSPVNKVFRTEFVKSNKLWFYKGIYHDDDEWLPRTIVLSERSYFTNEVIYDALTWDGCFGKMASDKSLTKKACDKMFLAKRCIEDINIRFPKDKSEFIKKYTEYYVRIYIGGVCALKTVKDVECRERIKSSIKDNSIFKYMKNCESKNLRLLGKVKQFFGFNFAVKMLLKRYGK